MQACGTGVARPMWRGRFTCGSECSSERTRTRIPRILVMVRSGRSTRTERIGVSEKPME